MLDFGANSYKDKAKILKSARFVQRELPIRLAHRLLDLQYLPYVVATNPHIKKVFETYYTSFNLLRTHPLVTTMEQNESLCTLLKALIDKNAPMIDALAKGIRECHQKLGTRRNFEALHLDDFLDSMLRSRISRRLMAEQHLNLGQNQQDGFVGVVQLELPVWNICAAAARNAELVCLDTYYAAPEVKIKGPRDLVLPYIPGHLEYILYELFKNAFRATVEHHISNNAPEQDIPPITVTLCKSTHGVTIKISDQGGGIPADKMKEVFRYGYTTVRDTPSMDQHDGDQLGMILSHRGDEGTVMAGLGFGLPMSRLFAHFFGGDLSLYSIEGYGTDVFISIKSLDHAELDCDGLNVL